MSFIRITYIFLVFLLVAFTVNGQQQEAELIVGDTLKVDQALRVDTLMQLESIELESDSVRRASPVPFEEEAFDVITLENDTIRATYKTEPEQVYLTKEDTLAMERLKREPFAPNSKKAVIYAAVCPGLGQIYNRMYWKLPILYGGFMGCIYAITWNNKNLQDFTMAHRDWVNDRRKDPEGKHKDQWSKSWQYYISESQVESKFNDKSYGDSFLKRNKDYFRRYRDLSIIISIGVYALSIVDAYVDAELFNFDISPDLSMKVEPIVSPETKFTPRTYGVGCNLTF